MLAPGKRGLEGLGPSDYEAVLGFLRQLYAVERLEAFPRSALVGLSRLIESEILTYNEIDPRRQRAHMIEEPAGFINASQVATFEHYAHQHPLIAHYARTRESQPRKISDFLSLSEFQGLGLHNEFFRPLSINYQMAVTIPSAPQLVIGIALNRSRRDFSERDRSILETIRPHLAQAYRNAAERTTLGERADAAERALRSSPAAALASLTRREHDVLVLVADGKTNRQIAERLTLSPRTVQKHLEHLYDKLGVRSRTAAAMMLASR
ncbi:MAG: helix-turn-helix transcriptional regulator [Chloroflexi bacterium]|nr:MAG: helix-turn-helix transcriptional regulator [Chloroflexota bacterium]